jgi:hypothetical protein
MKPGYWLTLLLALGAIWGAALGTVRVVREQKPTAEKLMSFAESAELSRLEGGARARYIDGVVERLNRLPFEERQKLRADRALEGTFRQMTPEEQGSFLDRTLPTGFKEVMEAFNRMTPEERRRHVERALRDMRARAGSVDEQRARADLDDAQVRRIIDQGLQSFYRDSTAETKMDLTPIVEEIQAQMQGFWRR